MPTEQFRLNDLNNKAILQLDCLTKQSDCTIVNNSVATAVLTNPCALRLVVGKPIIFNDGINKYLQPVEQTIKKDWKWLTKKLSHSTGALVISLGVLLLFGSGKWQLKTEAPTTQTSIIRTPSVAESGLSTIRRKHSLLDSLEDRLLFFKTRPIVQTHGQPIGESLVKKMVELHAKEKKAFFAQHLVETYQLDPNTSKEIVSNAFQVAEKNHIQPTLLLAMAEVESHFNPKAVSKAGAVGLVQVMPTAHPQLVKQIKQDGANLKQIKPNLMAGANILHEYIKRENGNVRVALQRYNGSLKDRNHRYAKKVLQAKAKLDRLSLKSNTTLLAKERG